MAITAAVVKELRERTGCGMMDCKRALTETNGDMDKAVEYLREKGLATATKKSGRIASEGIVYTYVADGIGVMVEVNSESDFVAKNAEFMEMVQNVALVIAKENPADVEALLDTAYVTGGTVRDALTEKIAKIGENMNIRRFARYEGTVAAYNHDNGRIGVMVLLDAPASDAALAVGKDVAMQIASYSPDYIAIEDVPADVVEHEKEILTAQALEEGKPAAVVEKMVVGRIRKFYDRVCLLEQMFIKDDEKKVKAYLAEQGGIAVKAFARFEKGEGLEKRNDDLAAEVASLVK